MGKSNGTGAKGLTAFRILEVLRRRTDADHRLSQCEIAVALKAEYGMEVDRKTIGENLSKLMELGYDVRYAETMRTVTGKDGKPCEQVMRSGIYLVPEFSEGELRLLIDSLMFSRFVPDVVVLKPQRLRDEIKANLEKGLREYE